MPEHPSIEPIVVYIVERHPLDLPDSRHTFQWINDNHGFRRELEAMLGTELPVEVTVLRDSGPGGAGWNQLLDALTAGKVKMVITHLAPLTPVQRQQLIGVCAEVGAQLVTPGDAGRNQRKSADDTHP